MSRFASSAVSHTVCDLGDESRVAGLWQPHDVAVEVGGRVLYDLHPSHICWFAGVLLSPTGGTKSNCDVVCGSVCYCPLDPRLKTGVCAVSLSEADTTRTCPVCGEQEGTERDDDTFRCPCGHEAHADICASRTFLEQQAGKSAVGSMARPVCLKWDDHNWSELPYSHESRKEARTDQSILRPA